MEKIKSHSSKGDKVVDVKELEESIKKFTTKVDGFVYPLIIPPLQSINEDILFEIYPDLRRIGKRDKLHVLLYSYGGDAHTAFHIGRLLQQYSTKELLIYVLREAKSAATLISCAADRIIFSDISELGPMDPQIRHNGTDERFSPLAIKHTFDLLQEETQKGHIEIVKSLTEKLPSPLILGEHLKSLETGKDYLIKLMKGRMFKEAESEKIIDIAEKLVMGYPDHGYCIDFTESDSLGLKVEHVSEDLDDEIFEVMQSYKIVWDSFDQHITEARKARKMGDKKSEEKELNQATELYNSLKKVTKNIIDEQIGKKEQVIQKVKSDKEKAKIKK